MSESTLPFPLITIAGNPTERGVQYGSRAKEWIARSLKIYGGAWSAAGSGRDAIHSRARRFADSINAVYPDMVEEMAGIARGAGVDFEDIVALNARTELMFGSQAPDEGCTTAVIMPELADGHVLMAQNWDWRPPCRDSAVLLRIIPERGPRILTFCEAGTLGRAGLNSAGIGVIGNFLRCDRDFQSSGLPNFILRRALLSCETLADAVGTALRAPRAFSSNHMLAHREGEAIDLEASPVEVFFVHPTSGMITHANHFTAHGGRVRDTGVELFPDTLFRDRRARRLLEQSRRPITPEVLMRIWRDHQGYPYSICRHLADNPPEDAIATVGSLILDVTEGMAWIAAGPTCENAYHGVPLVETSLRPTGAVVEFPGRN